MLSQMQRRTNRIAIGIEAREAQIAQLQAEISQLQLEQQRCNSVNAAMESALVQLMNAISLVRRHCPEEEAEFQQVINACFGSAVLLPPVVEGVKDDAFDEQAVDAEVEVVDEEVTRPEEAEANSQSETATDNLSVRLKSETATDNLSGRPEHEPTAEDLLQCLDRPKLMKLSRGKSLDGDKRGMSAQDLAKALAGQVSWEEVRRYKD